MPPVSSAVFLSGVCVFLTGGTVDAVTSWLTVLARRAMETLEATALPVTMVTVLTLPVIGAPAANVSRAFEAFVAVITGATGMILQDRPSVSLLRPESITLLTTSVC